MRPWWQRWTDGGMGIERTRERGRVERIRQKKRTMRKTEGQVVDIKKRQNTTVLEEVNVKVLQHKVSNSTEVLAKCI